MPGQSVENLFQLVEPSLPVKIVSFDEQLLILNSIRKPKRILIYGTDEKCYKFLVKGIEDLRLDQRIEQLFAVMNALLEDERDLQIMTYSVVPMTQTLGVLEWVD